MTRRYDGLVPRLALAFFVIVVVFATIASATTSPAPYSAYNSDWDGTSEFRVTASAATPTNDDPIAVDTRAYDTDSADATVAVVIAPSEPYTDEELVAIRSFVERGGTLVVAGDFGPEANQLLTGIGAAARLDGRPLRDERSFFRTGALPVVRNVRPDALTDGVESLTLNHPTAVEPNGAQVLVSTSGFGYLDTERNAQLDLTEDLASYPVVTAEGIGEGRVVTVSDASLFVNGMRDRTDNARFLDNIVTGRENVIIDFSHGATVPPFVIIVGIIREAPLLEALVVGGGVAAVALWVFVPGLGRRLKRLRLTGRRRSTLGTSVGSDTTSLRASLRRAHPDWDEANVDRVATVVSRRLADARRTNESDQ